VTSRLLAGLAAIALAVVGGVVGAAIYASSNAGGTTTTTVVNTVTTGGTGAAGRPIATPGGLTAAEIFRRTYQGVVDIKVVGGTLGGDESDNETSAGSGFVYDAKGNILTNQHVVDGASSITVKFWNGNVYKGQVVGADSFSDLAIVKVSAPPSILHPLTIGNSGKLQVGDGVVAIGSPFGLSQTMTSGIVSALHRGITSRDSGRRFTIGDSIQTDAPINHGNSGGPLLDASGHVVGVNTQIQSDSGGSDGVGFAVSATTIQRVAPKLILGQTVKYAYLGVYIQDATTASNATAGALVDGEVDAGTPAAQAGLELGDVIVRLAGTQITSKEDLTRVLDSKQPGDKVPLTYLRGGRSHTTTVTLGLRPS
jgi:putative serine protease PepD